MRRFISNVVQESFVREFFLKGFIEKCEKVDFWVGGEKGLSISSLAFYEFLFIKLLFLIK